MIPPFILTFLPRLIPFVVAASVGFSAAWYMQGLRVTAAKQELVEWQQNMVAAAQAISKHEQAQNVEAQNAWAKNLDELRRTWRNGWVPKLPAGAGLTGAVPPPGGTDETCTFAGASARELAAQCSEAVLQLNQLQSRVEAQKGY